MVSAPLIHDTTTSERTIMDKNLATFVQIDVFLTKRSKDQPAFTGVSAYSEDFCDHALQIKSCTLGRYASVFELNPGSRRDITIKTNNEDVVWCIINFVGY